MDRINSANTATLTPANVRGWQNENLSSGVNGTEFDATYENGVQEELLALLESVGLTASATAWAQVLQGLRRRFGGNYNYINTSATLTLDHAGVIGVDASGGAVTLTLPAPAALAGTVFGTAVTAPLCYRIFRTDMSANAVTVQAPAGEGFISGLSGGSSVEVPPGAELLLVGDGNVTWLGALRKPVWGVSGVISANTVLSAANDGEFLNVDNGAVVTLPAASGVKGMTVGFGAYGASATIDIIGGGGAFAGGAPSGTAQITLPNGAWVCVQSDGSNWRIWSASPDVLGYATQASLAAYATTSQVATDLAAYTPLAGFTGSLGATGWRKGPDGFIEQWGTAGSVTVGTGTTNTATVTFPVAFPTGCFQVLVSFLTPQGSCSCGAESISDTGCTVAYANNTGTTQTLQAYWRAIGH